jgi:hypothetical protein
MRWTAFTIEHVTLKTFKYIAIRRTLATLLLLVATMTTIQAQTDSISKALAPMDSIAKVDMKTLEAEKTTSVVVDSGRVKKPKRDWNTWRPNPQRALWLALVLPGAGQIYNRKYWKLPIIYGGFMGCIYALTWNNMMYKDYSQAYLDIMDNDPGTASYNKFLHLGVEINDQNMERYKSLFKSRKDKYRRWRDLSFFVMLGVYAISVIDAYVDAELSEFDISKDLSLKVSPAVIPNHSGGNPLQAQSLGVNCSLNF